MRSSWLIDATGRSAAVARSLGVKRSRDAPLVALYRWTVSHTADTDTRTLVEAVPDGWWYTARLPGNSRVVVLHVDAQQAASILRTPGGWQDQLARTRYVCQVLKSTSFVTDPRGTEACGARLERFASTRWLAVGDAAVSFDPLSSQGLLTALYTGMKAGQAVQAALSGEADLVETYANRLEDIRGDCSEHTGFP